MKLEPWLLEVWYGRSRSGWWLAPLGKLTHAVSTLRRWLYIHGWLPSTAVAVPVMVVGNITAGGTGKTPLVIWLVDQLAAAGLRVGVLTRGYRGTSDHWPVSVTRDTDPRLAGDEAVLIAGRTDAVVVAGPDRVAGARQLVDSGVQVIVCDDGLQHYRLRRDAEVAVIDAERGLGNGRFIPAGPLRESPARFASVTATVVNGGDGAPKEWMDAQPMQVTGDKIVALRGSHVRPLSGLAGQRVHAVAGIGNPERFFALLESSRIQIIRHVFPDHASYSATDLQFGDQLPVLMTEKDAVKCVAFATELMWSVPVDAAFTDSAAAGLCGQIAAATGLKIGQTY
ncbi:MAG: tetraacyldisaccharide 4'-kinase [Gammaproteobacteria bacterium]|nr:tetraacyldisaccharide 4'-kinase [Gammaproteobacteria bacterium]